MSYLLAYNPYNTNLFMRTRSIDPAAQDFIDATGITGVTQQTAINNLVKGLKADGTWSKMKAVYPFVTDNRNLVDYSEDFSNSAWAKIRTTVSPNTTTAPNGTLTADSLLDGTASGSHAVSTFKTAFGQNGNNTSTIYAKANTLNYLWMYFYNGLEPAGVYAFFNLSNGTVGTVQSGITATIENAGNGWYRCSITRNFNFTAANSNCGYGVSNADNVISYLGTNQSIYIWGAQVENGSTATTYQPIATTQQAFIASQFKYNLVNPIDSDAAFRLVFNGGWTHSSNGATPNGTNGFANTKVFNNTNLTDRASHWSAYLRTINANDGYFGYFNNFNVFGLQQRNSLNRFFLGVNSILTTGINSTNGYLIGKTDSTLGKVYVNNTQSETQVANVISGNLEFFLGGLNNNGSGAFLYSQHQYAFSTLGDKLSDTEAANLYTRVQTFNQTLGRQVGVPIVSDSDAQAFLNSAEITDLTQANAINTLVTDLKAQGLWTKMKAVYPFVGGTASTHKWNLKDPRDLDAAYRLVFNGGWTHSSNGATPNGTNGYADTKLNPTTVLTNYNAHSSTYNRTNGNDGWEIGLTKSVGGYLNEFLLTGRIGAQSISGLYDYNGVLNGEITVSSATAIGYFNNSVTSNTSHKIYKNGAQIGVNTNTNTSTPANGNIYLAAVNDIDTTAIAFSSKQTAFSTIGDGLNDTEAAALYNSVNNFQVALSRNV